MKKIVTSLFLGLLGTAFTLQAQTINYHGDFEGTPSDSGWVVNALSGVSTDEWVFDNPGARDFGVSISKGQFAIFDNADYGSTGTKEVELISPITNIGAQSLTTLGFYQYFEGGFSGSGEVFFSADGGTSFISVYQTSTTSIANPDKITVDLQPILNGFTPPYNCQIKFVYSAPDNAAFWWIVDDVLLYNSEAKDAAALKVEDLPSGCLVSLETPVTMTVKNLGNGNISTLEVNYILNQDSIITDTLDFNTLIGGPLLVGDSYTHTFDSLLQLKNGINDIKLWSSNPGGNADQFPLNDTIYFTTDVQRLAVVNLPLYEDFEDTLGTYWCKNVGPSGNGKIYIGDTLACSGAKMIVLETVSGKSSIDALDLLVNLSSCVEKTLSFSYGNLNDDQEAEDALYISVDNGGTFQKIYDFDMATSNDSCLAVSFSLDSVANALGISLSETSILRWSHAGNDLLSSGNDGLYIDDVTIDLFNLQAVDAEMTSIISPDTVSTLDTTDVLVRFKNLSVDTMVSVSLSYQYGSGTIVTEFWGGCLGQNDSITFTFATSLVPDSVDRTLCVWLNNPNNIEDLDSTNNNICNTVESDTTGGGNSISELGTLGNTKVYPNPTNGVIYFELPKTNEEVIIQIFNNLGQEIVRETTANHSFNINIEGNSKGLYFYSISTPRGDNTRGKITLIK